MAWLRLGPVFAYGYAGAQQASPSTHGAREAHRWRVLLVKIATAIPHKTAPLAKNWKFIGKTSTFSGCSGKMPTTKPRSSFLNAEH